MGFTGIDLAQHKEYLAKWLEAGYHGDMDWMASHGSKRTHPEDLVPGTSTVITARMDYLPAGEDPEAILASSEKAYISRYALGRDYHKLMRGRLAKLAKRIEVELGGGQYRAFVDNAPVLERALAENAGLGWIGKNTMLINDKAGSWFFSARSTRTYLTRRPTATDRALWELPGLYRYLSNECFHRPLGAGCQKVHLLPHHRIRWCDPRVTSPCDGKPIYGCDDCQLVAPGTNLRKPPASPTLHRATISMP